MRSDRQLMIEQNELLISPLELGALLFILFALPRRPDALYDSGRISAEYRFYTLYAGGSLCFGGIASRENRQVCRAGDLSRECALIHTEGCI